MQRLEKSTDFLDLSVAAAIREMQEEALRQRYLGSDFTKKAIGELSMIMPIVKV